MLCWSTCFAGRLQWDLGWIRVLTSQPREPCRHYVWCSEMLMGLQVPMTLGASGVGVQQTAILKTLICLWSSLRVWRSCMGLSGQENHPQHAPPVQQALWFAYLSPQGGDEQTDNWWLSSLRVLLGGVLRHWDERRMCFHERSMVCGSSWSHGVAVGMVACLLGSQSCALHQRNRLLDKMQLLCVQEQKITCRSFCNSHNKSQSPRKGQSDPRLCW